MNEQVSKPSFPGRARRLAALIALAAPIAAVVASVDMAARHMTNVVALVVSVAVVTVALWYVVTRRGLLRLAASAVAVLAAAAIILIGVSLFLTQVALLTLFAVAGRYALGPAAGALFAGGGPPRPAGAAHRGVLFINPRSGDGTAVRLNLAAAAADRGIRAITLAPGDDLAELAERAAADGADMLGMAGGDGSQAIVAAAAVRHGLAYACVPAGTRNHFALDLGLDRGDVLQALDAFTDAVERSVDLGQVNDRVFVNNASLGVYAEVVQSRSYRGAKLRTWGRLLPDLLGPTAAASDLEFDGPDGRPYTGVSLLLISNNPYELARVARAGGRPRLDTGRLGILAAWPPGAPRDHPRRRPRRFSDVMEWSRAGVEVRSADPVPIALDGETLLVTPPLRFSSLPGVLRVRLPRHTRATGRNAALSRRDLTALARIASGRPTVPVAGITSRAQVVRS
jgi:diacylglycerol kinase family enzyme